jgi:hypothetical protein
MRLLWGSEHILCSDCGERSLTFPKLERFMARKLADRKVPLRRPLSRRSRGVLHS